MDKWESESTNLDNRQNWATKDSNCKYKTLNKINVCIVMFGVILKLLQF